MNKKLVSFIIIINLVVVSQNIPVSYSIVYYSNNGRQIGDKRAANAKIESLLWPSLRLKSVKKST